MCDGLAPQLLTNTTSGSINGTTAVNGDYQWQYSSDRVNWTNITGANNSTYQPPILPVGTRYYRRSLSAALNAQFCTDISNDITVTVTPGPSIDFRTPDNVTVSATTTYAMCSGDNAQFQVNGGRSYEFRINNAVFYTVGTATPSAWVTYDPLIDGTSTYTLADGDFVDVIVYDTPLTASNTIDYANACSTRSSSVTVNVATLPGVTLNATSILGNVFCPGDAVDFQIVLSPSDPTATFEYFVVGGGGTWVALGGTSTFTINMADTPGVSDSATVTVRVTTASCSTQVTESIFIQENDITTAGTISRTDVSVCAGEEPGDIVSTAPAVATMATASISYQWYQKPALASPASWTIVAGARGQAATLNFTGYPISVDYQYYREAISDVGGQSCTTSTTFVQISALPLPVSTFKDPALNTISSASTYSICSGDAAEMRVSGGRSYQFRINGSVVYTAGSATPSTEITFDPSINATHTLINGDVVDVVVYNLPLTASNTIDTDACSSTTPALTFSVATTPSPTISAVGIAGNTFCSGEAVTFNVSSTTSVPSPSYSYSINGSPFVAIVGNSFTVTMSNTTVGVSDNVTVTLRMGSGSCSTLVTTTLFLEESELISLGTVSLTDTSVCVGTIPGNIVSTASPTATISGTSFAYRWQQRANTATSTWVDIPNPRGDKETLTFSGSPLTESTLFRRNITYTVNGQACTEFGTQQAITVTNPPVLTFKYPSSTVVSAPTTASICDGETVVFRASGGLSYEFLINGAVEYTVGSSLTTTEIIFDPSLNASHTIINNDFVEVRVYNLGLTVSNTIDLNACFSASSSVTFNVSNAPSPTIAATSIVGNTFCSGDTVTFNVGTVNPVVSPTYEFSINGGIYQTISGTTFSLSMSNTTVGVSDNVTITIRLSSGSCSIQSTTTLFLQESEVASRGTISATVTSVCVNQIPGDIQSTASASATLPGTNIEYRWQQRADTATSVWVNIPGARGASPTLNFAGVPLLESTLFRRNVITTVNSQTCTVEGLQVVKIETTPPPSPTFKDPAGVPVNAPSSYTICSGDTVEFRASGGLSYVFRINGVDEYTVGSSNTATEVIFDPFVDASHTLINNDYVDVEVYNLGLTASNTIDPDACFTLTNSVTFIVNNKPTPTLSATNITGNTYCPGQDVEFSIGLSPADPSATFEYHTGGPWSASFSTTTFTINLPNATVNASDNVTITLRVTTGLCSSTVTTTLYLVENEITDPGTISATTLDVCSGDIPGDIVSTSAGSATISGTTFTYQWYQRPNGTTTWTLIGPGTNPSLTFTSPITQTMDFVRETIARANGQSCTESITAPVTIFITAGPGLTFFDPTNTAVSTPTTYNMCQGTNQVFRATGGLSYEFRINGTVRYTVGAATNTDIVTFDPLVNATPSHTLATGNFVDVIVYDRALTASSTIDPDACSSESTSITVNVSPLSTLGVNATNIFNRTFCPDQDVDFAITVSPADPTATFEYSLSTSITWVPISSATTFTVNMGNPTLNVADNVTVTVRMTSGNCSTTVIQTVYLEENEIIDPGTVSATTPSVCSGDTPGDIVSTSAGSATISGTSFSHQWYQRPNGTTTWTLISYATNATLNFLSPITQDMDYIRVTTATANGQSCTESMTTPVTIFITAGPGLTFFDPTNTAVSTPTTYNMCQGTNQVFRATGGLSYEFRINGTVRYTVGAATNTDIVTFDPLVNATPSHTLATGNFVDVIVYDRALTASSTIDPDACSSESTSITVNVSPLSTLGVNATNIFNRTFCPDQDVDFAITVSPADPTATFEYSLSTSITWVPISSATTFTVNMGNPTLNVADNVTVTVRMTSGNCSTTVIQTVYLEENEIIDPGTVSATTPSVCSGDTPGDIVSTSAGSATISGTSFSHQWYQRPNGTTTWTLISYATNATLNFLSPITQDMDYIRVTTATANGQSCTESMTTPVTIFITAGPGQTFFDPSNTPVTSATTYNMCAGNQVFRATGGLSYEFRINGTVRYTVGAATNTDIVTFDPLINATPSHTLATGNFVDVIVYDRALTASSTIDPDACSSQSASVTVNVSPLPDPSISATNIFNNVFCAGEAVDFSISLAVSDPTATFEYEVSTASPPGWVSIGSNTTFTVTMTNRPGLTDHATVTIRVTSGSCSTVVTEAIYLEENEITNPGAINTLSSTVCSGGYPGDIVETVSTTFSVTGSVTYQWYQRASGATTWTLIPGPRGEARDLTFASNPLFSTTQFRREVINTYNSQVCERLSSPSFVTISISSPTVVDFRSPAGPVTAPTTLAICTGSNQEFRVSGGLSYEFRINGSVRYTAGASLTSDFVTFDPLIDASYTLATNDVVDVILYDNALTASNTIDLTSCFSQSEAVTITTSPSPIPTITAVSITGDTFCPGEAVTFNIALAASDTTATFEYDVSTASGWTSIGSNTSFTVTMTDRPNLSDHATITVRVTSGLCSTTVTNTLYLEENEVVEAGTISTTDLLICAGTDPQDIFELTAPTFTMTGTIKYQWYERANLTTTTWTAIGPPRGTARDLVFSGNPISEDTRFYRETINEINGQSCSENTLPITVRVKTLSPEFRTPDNAIVSGTSNYSMCEGPAEFQARFGRSYQFRINGSVVYTAGSTSTNSFVTFDALTDHVSAPYVLTTGDVIDVLVYDLPLTASLTIDPDACPFPTSAVTLDVSRTPSFTITTSGTLNSYCPSSTYTFIINPLSFVNTATTYEYSVPGSIGWTSLGSTTKTFSVVMPNIAGPAASATITVRATDPDCSGTPVTFSLNLPENELTSAGVISATDTTVCFGEEPGDIVESIAPSSTISIASITFTYQWYQQPTSPVTTTWTAIGGPRGEARDLNFSGFPLTEETRFRRETFSEYLGETCGGLFTAPVVLSTVTVPVTFIDPSLAAVTTDTNFNMCAGPQEFRARGGQSYEFRINGFVVYTVNTGDPTIDATFEALTDHVSAPYTLANGDRVDVLSYDLPLLGGVIDPSACSSASPELTLLVSDTPSVTITTSGTANSYCPSSTVEFVIGAVTTLNASTTFEYSVPGTIGWTSIGTSRTFSVVMPDLGSPAATATISVRATDPDCPGTPVVTSITLAENQLLTAGVISATDTTVCFGEEPGDIVESIAPSSTISIASITFTYQWYQQPTSPVTTTWTAIGGPRGEARDLNFSGFPLTEETRFRRETFSEYLGETCGGLFTAPVVLSTVTVPVTFIDPSLAAVTTDTNFNMCAGPQEFRARGGQSYEFRINGFVVYTVNTGDPTIDATFEALTDHVSAPYTLANGDRVDVLSYDLPLLGGVIDPSACSSASPELTLLVSDTPSVTITTSGTANSYCPSSTVEFVIGAVTTLNASTTFEYSVPGTIGWTSIGTSRTFSVVMPDLGSPAATATISVRATDPDCPGTPVVTSITLAENQLLTAGVISATDTTVCFGEEPGDIVESIAPSSTISIASITFTYQWYQQPTSPVTTTWTAIGGPRGEARDLNFSGFPLTEETRFRRETFSEYLGETCGGLFTAPVVLSTVTVPVTFIDPSLAAVTTDTNFNMCAGPQEFRARGGQSYEFRINGFVVYTVNTGDPTIDATFEALTDHVSAPYTLANGDRVDVLSYDLPLLGGVIDPSACSSASPELTLLVSDTPSVTITTSGTANSYCPSSTVEFVIGAVTTLNASTTFEYSVPGTIGWTSIGTSRTFSVVMPDLGSPAATATISVRATDPDCPGTPVVTSITLAENQLLTAGVISATDTTVCFGEEPGDIVESIAPSSTISIASITFTYQWYQQPTSPVTTTWTAIGGPRGEARDLNFSGFPLTEETRFRRETFSEYLGETCGGLFTAPVVLSTVTVPVTFIDPSLAAVTTDTNFNMCAGPQEFRARGGQSYEFRINGFVVYTVNTGDPTIDATFEALTDHVSAPYTLANGDRVDVLSYDLPLLGGVIDPSACSSASPELTLLVSDTPSVTITTSGTANSYCPSSTVEFVIGAVTTLNASTTFEYSVPGTIGWTSIGTSRTFSVVARSG